MAQNRCDTLVSSWETELYYPIIRPEFLHLLRQCKGSIINDRNSIRPGPGRLQPQRFKVLGKFCLSTKVNGRNFLSLGRSVMELEWILKKFLVPPWPLDQYRGVRHPILRSSNYVWAAVKNGCYIPRLNRRHSMDNHRLNPSILSRIMFDCWLGHASFFTSLFLCKSTQTIRKIVTFLSFYWRIIQIGCIYWDQKLVSSSPLTETKMDSKNDLRLANWYINFMWKTIMFNLKSKVTEPLWR